MTSDNEKYVDYLDFSESTWKRPELPKKIWRVIDGRKKTADGHVPRFSIQEVPEELEEDVADFMVKYLLPDEPCCSSLGIHEDPLASREFRTLWRDILRCGLSVVALTVNSDPSAKPVIAGVNVLTVVTAEDEKKKVGTTQKFRTLAMRTLTGMMHTLTIESDVIGRYGVDKYLGAFGLCVDPFFRGQGLGEELLRTRDDIGLTYQMPVTETVFTAIASQILASRVGFEVLVERKYIEFFDEAGNIAFPGVTTEFIKVMGKRLDQHSRK